MTNVLLHILKTGEIMKTIASLRPKNKRVFLRLDLNVPLRNGVIQDDARIKAAFPTIQLLLEKGAKQIIMASHLGRPKGVDQTLSLAPVAKRLTKLLGKKVHLHTDVSTSCSQPLVLLENLRFFEGEKKGSVAFARQLANHADVYVSDAFGTAHRKDASVYALPKLLPSAGGLLLQKEKKYVHLRHKQPVVAIFGAAKIADKLPLLESLLKKVDKVLLGGAVVFTFLRALDGETGTSLVEEEMIPKAKQLLEKYPRKIVLPVDFAVTSHSKLKKFDSFSVSQRKEHVSFVDVLSFPKRKAGFDIGPKSVRLFSQILSSAQTIVWNGPLGMFEVKPFDAATRAVARSILDKTVIVCGGDTVSALRSFSFTHKSTGGGASLQLLSGKKLPGLEVLT